jgi:hypothetical protein
MLDQLSQSAPALVAGVKDWFGVIALALILLGMLAYPTTNGAGPKVRAGTFIFLVVCFLGALGIAAFVPPPSRTKDTADDLYPEYIKCLGYTPIKQLGWTEDHKTDFCKERGWDAGNFNPGGRYADGGYCMKGDGAVCRKAILAGVPPYVRGARKQS